MDNWTLLVNVDGLAALADGISDDTQVTHTHIDAWNICMHTVYVYLASV